MFLLCVAGNGRPITHESQANGRPYVFSSLPERGQPEANILSTPVSRLPFLTMPISLSFQRLQTISSSIYWLVTAGLEMADASFLLLYRLVMAMVMIWRPCVTVGQEEEKGRKGNR